MRALTLRDPIPTCPALRRQKQRPVAHGPGHATNSTSGGGPMAPCEWRARPCDPPASSAPTGERPPGNGLIVVARGAGSFARGGPIIRIRCRGFRGAPRNDPEGLPS